MASVLTKNEVSRAQVGPRELKNPRSKEYAIQTLYALKRYAESLRCDQERIAQELAEIERYRHWEVLGYPSKAALLKTELNALGLVNTEKVKATLEASPDLQSNGRPKKGISRIPLSKSGSARLAARLKRNHPEICERIAAGEFTSIRAAAKAAGIVRDKTPLEQLQRWWKKTSEKDRLAFLDGVRTP
jgi:hypothetical protein